MGDAVMKKYVAKKINGIVDWNNIDIANINTPYLETPDYVKAYAQLCYDENALYSHLRAVEREVRAEEFGPIGKPYEDSCLEFFFCPEENDKRYFNIEFNSNACIYLGIGADIDRVRLLPENGSGTIFCPKINRFDDGWEIFYTVPFDFIRIFFPGFKVYNGKSIRANFFKCADLTTPSNYLSWSPVEGEPFTFHKQHCFGVVELS